MLMGMLFFIYAIIGMQLFGNLVFIIFSFFTVIYIFNQTIVCPGDGPPHCHREAQQLPTHLPEPACPLQVSLSQRALKLFDW